MSSWSHSIQTNRGVLARSYDSISLTKIWKKIRSLHWKHWNICVKYTNDRTIQWTTSRNLYWRGEYPLVVLKSLNLQKITITTIPHAIRAAAAATVAAAAAPTDRVDFQLGCQRDKILNSLRRADYCQRWERKLVWREINLLLDRRKYRDGLQVMIVFWEVKMMKVEETSLYWNLVDGEVNLTQRVWKNLSLSHNTDHHR